MQSSLCTSCRDTFRSRLKHKISVFQASRRLFSGKSWYWDTSPPNDLQLAASRWFFKAHPPKKLWTATEWRKQNSDSGILIPEVAFLGRSNVGKSSLLNAVLDSPGLNRVGPRPGKTTMMHAWGLSATDPKTGGALKGWKGQTDTRVAVLDAPGYGHASRNDWGTEIIKYLSRRKQLRRVFVLIDAMHGVKSHDRKMLELLQSSNISHQLIASKVDRQRALDSTMRSIQEVAQPQESRGTITALGEILAVGGLDDTPKTKPSGIDDVQWAVLRAAGIDEFAVENFKRLQKDEALKHSTTPRLPNAQSHLVKISLREPQFVSQLPEPLLVAEGLSKVQNAQQASPSSMPSTPPAPETARDPLPRATTTSRPNVFHGFAAMEAQLSEKRTAKPPTSFPARRSGGGRGRNTRLARVRQRTR